MVANRHGPALDDFDAGPHLSYESVFREALDEQPELAHEIVHPPAYTVALKQLALDFLQPLRHGSRVSFGVTSLVVAPHIPSVDELTRAELRATTVISDHLDPHG